MEGAGGLLQERRDRPGGAPRTRKKAVGAKKAAKKTAAKKTVKKAAKTKKAR